MLGGRGASSHSPLEVAGHGLVLGRGEQGRGLVVTCAHKLPDQGRPLPDQQRSPAVRHAARRLKWTGC